MDCQMRILKLMEMNTAQYIFTNKCAINTLLSWSCPVLSKTRLDIQSSMSYTVKRNKNNRNLYSGMNMHVRQY